METMNIAQMLVGVHLGELLLTSMTGSHLEMLATFLMTWCSFCGSCAPGVSTYSCSIVLYVLQDLLFLLR